MPTRLRVPLAALPFVFLLCACALVARTVSTLVPLALLPLPSGHLAPTQGPVREGTPPLASERLAHLLGLPAGGVETVPGPRRSPLPLRLLGTLVSSEEEDSLAALLDEEARHPRTVRTGSVLHGAEVLRVERTRVLLWRAGQLEALELAAPPAGGLAPRTAAPLPGPDAGGVGGVAPVRQTGPDAYAVRRAEVERALRDVGSWASLRVVPVFRDGVARGFRVGGIREGSPLAQLGLENGDVLSRINGLPLDGPEQALEAFTRLREARHLELELERGSRPVRKTYDVAE